MRPATAANSRRFSTSAPISIRVPRWATRATTTNQTARPHVHAEYARQSRIDPTPKTCPPSSKSTLQGADTHQTSGRQAQALRAYHASMREDDAELRLVRRACLRLYLDRIRPPGLARSGVASAAYTRRRDSSFRCPPWRWRSSRPSIFSRRLFTAGDGAGRIGFRLIFCDCFGFNEVVEALFNRNDVMRRHVNSSR